MRPNTWFPFCFMLMVVVVSLAAQQSDWMDRQMQGLEQTLSTSEPDTDANSPLDQQQKQERDNFTENFEHQQAMMEDLTDQAVNSMARNIAAQINLNRIHSDQDDPLLREIDIKQQELAGEHKNYQVAYRQIHNQTDKWIPLYESLIARGQMYQANVIVSPEDPAERLAEARQRVKESRIDRDKAAVRIWELRREIALLKRRLWSRPNQTPLDAIEADVVDDEKLNLWLSLEEQGLDVTQDDLLPSVQQLATQQALAEALSGQEDMQTKVAQEVSERLVDYLQERQATEYDSIEADKSENEPLVQDETWAGDVNEILSGDSLAEESPEVRQLCDDILQGLKENRKVGEEILECMDESGQITAVVDGVETVLKIQDIVKNTKQLNQDVGEDVAMAYLSARVASLVAHSVGGMYEAASVYLEIGAKTLQVGSNVVSKATLGPNQEVPVNKINFGPNKAIGDHSQETDEGLRMVNIVIEGETTPIEIYFWKQIYIEGQDGQQTEAWVPYDDLGNAYDYVFLVTSKPYALGLLGEYDMEVFRADTQKIDQTQEITLKAKGSYKNE